MAVAVHNAELGVGAADINANGKVMHTYSFKIYKAESTTTAAKCNLV
jgi:hypothetical protein